MLSRQIDVPLRKVKPLDTNKTVMESSDSVSATFQVWIQTNASLGDTHGSALACTGTHQFPFLHK